MEFFKRQNSTTNLVKEYLQRKAKVFFDKVNISLDTLLFELLHSSGSEPNQPTSLKLVTHFRAILR